MLKRICSVALLASGCLFSIASSATTPASGAVSESSKEISFTSGPYPVANTSGALADYKCDMTNPCDNFALTVDVTENYLATHLKDRVSIALTPDTAADDVDLQLRDASGKLLGSSRGGPGAVETIIFRPTAGGAYTLETVGGTPATGASTKVTLYTDPNAADAVPPPPAGAAGSVDISHGVPTPSQIGRASCRERVYVLV